ncbi:MAG: hypothetical protein ACK5Q5_14880 [Planctomycetaceae bacterium]
MLRIARWAAPALVCGISLGATTLPLQAADSVRPVPSSSSAAEPSDNLVGDDVTDEVEVELTATPRPSGKGRLVSGVKIRNTSGKDLTGRLVVVLKSAGFSGITLADNDGELASGERYVEVLAETATLKADAGTSAKKIEFATPDLLTADARKGLNFQFRVLRLDPAETAAVKGAGLASENLPGKKYTQARLDAVQAIQDRHTAELLSHEGVFGTATGEDDNGNLVVLVYTQRHGIIKDLPGQVEGVSLEQTVIGTSFKAGPAWKKEPPKQPASSLLGTTTVPTDPTARFTRPVPIGVSLFNFDDSVCAAGTLGCRIVFPDGSFGILTNSHVGAQEGITPVSVGNPLLGFIGDQWSQPGCLDSLTFEDDPADILATLVDFQPFDAAGINQIDAAIGRINMPNRDLVAACTPVDGYGFPSRTPVNPIPGTRVMKYGRTTGFRKGKIRGINANVAVAYTAFTNGVFFTNQIDIYGDHANFGMPGDSGSLIVTEAGHHPVALLFAGSGLEVLGNPIQLVLQRFNVAIDDGTGTPPELGPNGKVRTPGAGLSGRMGGAGGRLVP